MALLSQISRVLAFLSCIPVVVPPEAPRCYTDDLTIREARDRFLAQNGFRLDDYTAPTYTIKFWQLPVKFPNTRAHQWATPLHDLHHVLTGFQTDWIGEAEVAVWELRGGCKTLIVYWLDLWGALIGLFISPSRVLRAYRAAKGQRTLYRDPALSKSVLEVTVGETRARLGIPPGGISSRPPARDLRGGNPSPRAFGRRQP